MPVFPRNNPGQDDQARPNIVGLIPVNLMVFTVKNTSTASILMLDARAAPIYPHLGISARLSPMMRIIENTRPLAVTPSLPVRFKRSRTGPIATIINWVMIRTQRGAEAGAN